MILVKISRNLKNELSEFKIKNIIKESFNLENFEYKLEIENRNIGKYLILESQNEIKFVLVSRFIEDGRNSYLIQRVPPVYTRFISYKTNKNKFLECYLFEENRKILTSYQLFILKILLTLNFKILNIENFEFEVSSLIKIEKFIINSNLISKFQDFKEIRRFRYLLSNRNSGNIPTTFEMVDNKINVYGKTYGANGMETVIISLALREILKNVKIFVYEMNEKSDNYETKTSRNNEEILKYFNIDLIKENISLTKRNTFELAKRNQRVFRINLLNKFKEKKCFLCDCEIENLIIASHIHRVTDIINDVSIDENTKNFQITDADNGLWLCANHDKLFENGFIIFLDNKIYLNSEESILNKHYIKHITKDNEYIRKLKEENQLEKNCLCYIKNNEYINDNTKKYLKKHLSRICEK